MIEYKTDWNTTGNTRSPPDSQPPFNVTSDDPVVQLSFRTPAQLGKKALIQIIDEQGGFSAFHTMTLQGHQTFGHTPVFHVVVGPDIMTPGFLWMAPRLAWIGLQPDTLYTVDIVAHMVPGTTHKFRVNIQNATGG